MANYLSNYGTLEWDYNGIIYNAEEGRWEGVADTYRIESHPPYKYVIGSNIYVYAWPSDDSTDFLASMFGWLNQNYVFWGSWSYFGQDEYDDVITFPGYRGSNPLYGFFISIECMDYPPEIEYSIGDYSIEGFDAYPDDATISGVVTDYKGNPVESAIVVYGDQDPRISGSTNIGVDYTDAQGQYKINIDADTILYHEKYNWPNVKEMKENLIVWGDVSAVPVSGEEYLAIKENVFLGFQAKKTADFQLNLPIGMILGSILVNSEVASKTNKIETGMIKTNISLPVTQKIRGSIIVNTKLGRKEQRAIEKTSGILLSGNYQRICYGPDVLLSLTNMIVGEGGWLVAENAEEDISIGVSFPNPEFKPAGLVVEQRRFKKQTFEINVKKSIDSIIDPVIQIYYYSKGSPVKKSRKIKIISTVGQIVKWEWYIDSNFKKKNVECKINSTSYNYGDVKKCGVDIEYIAWCGVYDLSA